MSLCPAWQNTALRTHPSRLVEARAERDRQTDRQTEKGKVPLSAPIHPDLLKLEERERDRDRDTQRKKERKNGRLTLNFANGLEIARCNWERNGLTFERT